MTHAWVHYLYTPTTSHKTTHLYESEMLTQVIKSLWRHLLRSNDHNYEVMEQEAPTAPAAPESVKVEFEIRVSPKRSSYKKTIDIGSVTIEHFLNSIYLRYPDQKIPDAKLTLIVNEERFIPMTDGQLREVFEIAMETKKIVVIISTSFSKYTFLKVADLYGFPKSLDPDEAIPRFSCGYHSIDNDSAAKEIFEKLIDELENRIMTVPCSTSNEAAKSIYTLSFLARAASVFPRKIKIYPQYRIEGEKGQGNVDFAIISTTSDLEIGVTEVKKDDFHRGIAQNVVQLDSALDMRRKRRHQDDDGKIKIFGIVTDAIRWFFLLCSEGEEGPKFQISKSYCIDYGSEEDFKHQAKEIFCHMLWIFDYVQDEDEDRKRMRLEE